MKNIDHECVCKFKHQKRNSKEVCECPELSSPVGTGNDSECICPNGYWMKVENGESTCEK